MYIKWELHPGAGVSYNSKLPLWDGFLKDFIDFCDIEINTVVDKSDKFDDVIKASKQKLKSKPNSDDYLQIAMLFKSIVLQLSNNSKYKIRYNFIQQFKHWFQKKFNQPPSEWHETIVATNYPFIITTNYDLLLEDAANAKKFNCGKMSYSQEDADRVAESIYTETTSIIHMHGKATDNSNDLADIVLTDKDYMEVMRKYPGFTLAMQTLFMRYSVLFVGYGGYDPHLEILLKELAYYFKFTDSSNLPRYFLLKNDNEVNLLMERHKKIFRTEIISTATYDEQLSLLKDIQTKFNRKK